MTSHSPEGTPTERSTDLPSGVSVRLEGSLLHVRLRRPESRNAQSPAMWRDLASIEAMVDREVRAVVLSAEGPSFSAGLDRRMLAGGIDGQGSLVEFAGLPAEDLDHLIAGFQQAFLWWRRCPVPSVAAVHGHAVGAGFQLALACDVMIVADDAQLAMREPSLGLVPDLGGTLPLVEAVGYGRALEIVLSGRWVAASEAVALGIAQAIVPAAGLVEAASVMAQALSSAPAGAVAATKALLRSAATRAGADWSTAHEAQAAVERAAQGQRFRDLLAGTTGQP